MSEIDKILLPCGGGNDNAMTTAMMANNWQNNPFLYLILLAMFGRNGLWGGNGENCASEKISTLQNTVADNHNANITNAAVGGNTEAIRSLASNMNCDFNSVSAAVSNVKSAIDLLAGQTGYSAESVKNAILMGDQNIMSKMADCCCQMKENVLKMGYENQLANERQTNAFMSRIDQLANGVQQGFASIGFQMQTDKCDIINAGNANTQRIVDTLNNHWTADLQQKYADAKLELSQLNQNATLIAALKTTA